MEAQTEDRVAEVWLGLSGVSSFLAMGSTLHFHLVAGAGTEVDDVQTEGELATAITDGMYAAGCHGM